MFFARIVYAKARTRALQRTAPGRLRVSRLLLPADPPRSSRATLRRPSAVSELESFGHLTAPPHPLMTEGIITAITKFLELAPRYLAVVALATGLILFGPPDTVKTLGLSEFAQTHRSWLGASFIISSALTVISFVRWIGTWSVAFFLAGRTKRAALKRLHNLTEDEKQILRYYLANDTRGNTLRYDDGVVQGLVTAHIIYRSANMGNMLEGFPYNIANFAWDYLQKHPDLLVGSTNTYRTDKRQSLWGF